MSLPGKAVRGSRSGRPIMALLDQLGRRWTLRVLWELREGDALTFRALQARCGGLSPSVLNQRLGELKDMALVEAADDGYRLTPRARELVKLFAPIAAWSEKWAAELRRGR